MHFFLQDVLRSALRRNCVKVFFLRVNVYSQAGKREQGFENVVVEIGGRLFDTVQEPALRHAFGLKVWQRKLANAEVPAWMACPFDVQITRKPEIQLTLPSHQLSHNGP